MSEKIKGLVTQLFFGIDTANGIGSVAILGLLFGVQEPFIAKVGYLLFAGFCAYLPDLDWPIFFLLRKRFGWTNHWIVGHYPMIVIPALGLFVFYFASALGLVHVEFLTALAVVCVTGHFVHDSTEVIGLQCFAPFNWTHVTLRYGWPRLVDRSVFEDYVREDQEKAGQGAVDQLLILSEPVTPKQKAFWTIAVLMFGLWILL